MRIKRGFLMESEWRDGEVARWFAAKVQGWEMVMGLLVHADYADFADLKDTKIRR